MEYPPLDPLVHFVFIYYMAVHPGYRCKRITPEQLEKLRTLRDREQIHYACELTGFEHEDKVKHLDWMVSRMSWQFCRKEDVNP